MKGKAGEIEHWERKLHLTAMLDEYIVMPECVYRRQMKNDPALLNFFWNRTSTTEDDLLLAIGNDELFGLAKVDIICPDEAKRKYLELNFPPIFRHVEVEKDMLSPIMQEYAERKKVKFPMEKQLGLTFNAKEIVLATPLLRYYLQNGLKVTRIHYFVEYGRDMPFKPFVDKMVSMRVRATDEGNALHQSLAKILMNSSWGRLGRRRLSFYY